MAAMLLGLSVLSETYAIIEYYNSLDDGGSGGHSSPIVAMTQTKWLTN